MWHLITFLSRKSSVILFPILSSLQKIHAQRTCSVVNALQQVNAKTIHNLQGLFHFLRIFASKCSKKLATFNLCKLHFLAASALECKYENLDIYPHVINKKYFDHYTYRIVVFSPKENVFAYMLERFDIKTRSWVNCYESAKGFNLLSELYDDLESSFADVILED